MGIRHTLLPDHIAAELPPDVAEVEITHRLHKELGAPDITEDPAWRIAGETKGKETGESRAKALARQQLDANSRALRQQTMAPRTCRRGHSLVAGNVYAGKHGSQCRECRNLSYRKAA